MTEGRSNPSLLTLQTYVSIADARDTLPGTAQDESKRPTQLVALPRHVILVENPGTLHETAEEGNHQDKDKATGDDPRQPQTIWIPAKKTPSKSSNQYNPVGSTKPPRCSTA
jgi:hypothetical protein